MRIAMWATFGRAEVAARLAALPGVDLILLDSKRQLLAGRLDDIEVFAAPAFFWDAEVAAAFRRDGRSLRFVQLLSAGYEEITANGVPPGTVVANAGDAWSPAVAEHALGLLLGLVKDLPQALANQRRHVWDRAYSARMGTLRGRTLAIVGFGSIGREIARYARPLGMRIVGLTRSGAPHELADEMRPLAELARVLPQAGAIVLAVAYAPATHHILGTAELARCRPEAVLVNIARGGLVDGAALAAALRRGAIAGAALDVTDPEPLPADSPLWECPNLILTPHTAGACGPAGSQRLAEVAAANIGRFAAGRPLEHVLRL